MDRYPTQQEIAQRAYDMWEQEGCPHGRSLDHWLAAEQELSQASATTMPMPISADGVSKPARRTSSASPKVTPPKAKPRSRAEKPAAKDLH